jgi:hypothetical protein
MEDFLIRNFSRGIHAIDPTDIPAVISVDDLGSNLFRVIAGRWSESQRMDIGQTFQTYADICREGSTSSIPIENPIEVRISTPIQCVQFSPKITSCLTLSCNQLP